MEQRCWGNRGWGNGGRGRGGRYCGRGGGGGRGTGVQQNGRGSAVTNRGFGYQDDGGRGSGPQGNRPGLGAYGVGWDSGGAWQQMSPSVGHGGGHPWVAPSRAGFRGCSGGTWLYVSPAVGPGRVQPSVAPAAAGGLGIGGDAWQRASPVVGPGGGQPSVAPEPASGRGIGGSVWLRVIPSGGHRGGPPSAAPAPVGGRSNGGRGRGASVWGRGGERRGRRGRGDPAVVGPAAGDAAVPGYYAGRPASRGRLYCEMASGTSSRGDSRVRRQRVVHDSPVSQPALPLPLSSTSPAVGTSTCQSAVGSSSTQSWGRGHGRRGPTRGVTESRLEDGSRWNVKVIGGTGVGERGVNFVSKMGTVIRVHCKLWDDNFVKLPETTKDAIFRDLQLCYEWERTPTTDRQMISHMTTMHRNWRGTLKQRNFKGKSFEDAIASVPAGVDPSEWQTMCEIWTTPERRRIAQRNQENRSHQSMAYSRGRISHTQMIDDFERTHQRTPHRMELFKMGRCHELPDGTEHWVDEESSHRYERMTQMVDRPEGQVDDVPITHESAFIATMGRDRPGRIRCAGSAETLTSWYGSRESASTSSHRHDSQEVEQLKQLVLIQSTEMGRMRTEITDMREQMTLFMSQFRGSSSTALIAPDPDPDDDDVDGGGDDDVDGGGDDNPTR